MCNLHVKFDYKTKKKHVPVFDKREYMEKILLSMRTLKKQDLKLKKKPPKLCNTDAMSKQRCIL